MTQSTANSPYHACLQPKSNQLTNQSYPINQTNHLIVQGYCEQTPVNLMIDTGASVSLVATRLVHNLDKLRQIEPTKTLIAGLENKIVPTRGEITLPITFNNVTINHCFIVSDHIDNEFLLGMDILKRTKSNINIQHRSLTFLGQLIPFTNKPKTIKNRMKIKLNKIITIPPNTAIYLSGKIAIPNGNQNYEGVVQPNNNLATSQQVFVTPSLSYSDRHLIPIHCLNLNKTSVTLYRNQVIAFLEPVNTDNTVHSVHRVSNSLDNYNSQVTNIERLPSAETIESTIENGRWQNPEELYKQLQIDELQITCETKTKLKELIAEFSHCFSKHRFDLGCCSFYEAKLNLKPGYTPKWIPSRPISYKLQPKLDEEIENLQKHGHVEPCKYSLWNSQIFLVGKPNGQHRLVVDGRMVNKNLIQDSYNLPKIRTLLDNMHECNWLSSFDFTSSFTQISLQNSSKPVTAFSCNNKRMQWTRMTMGMLNSSAEFSRCIQQLFSYVPFDSLCIYVDDLCLGSLTEQEHLKRLRFILERLTWGNFKLSPSKTKLFRKELTFVGHKISKKRSTN